MSVMGLLHTRVDCLAILTVLVCAVAGQIQFSKKVNDLLLPEDTPVGKVIFSSSLRNGANLIVTSENRNTNVTVTRAGVDFLDFDIILNTHLDYDSGERQLICLVKGESNDGTNKQNTDLKIIIFVSDVNDEVPVLQNQPYSVSVSEDTLMNEVIYSQISASDPDRNDQMSYQLTASSRSQTTDSKMFTINNVNGELILNGHLDFESVRFYQFTVTVMDQAGHNTSADVFITILDAQDTPPYFTGEPFQTQMLEDTNPGTSLITVKAADGDKGLSNGVFLSILNETCKGLFQIGKTSGVVSLKTTADRDAGQVYDNNGICTLEIQATEDNQHPQTKSSSYTAVTLVTITVMDINDNVPVFSYAPYTVTVDENIQQGTPINLNAPINVIDPDQGNNAVFDIKVTKLQNYFEVTPSRVQSKGEILIRVTNSTILDYENHTSLSLELEAIEITGPGISTAAVTIFLNNVNDNSPVFSNSTFFAKIEENSPSGTSVIKITATDADINDSNNYATIIYTLEGSDSIFEINRFSGLVTVGNGSLNREVKDTYYVTVIAEDGGHSKTNAVLEIKVTDANDETPTFIQNEYQTSLKELETNFLQPVIVHANDNDEPNTLNSKIEYRIISTLPPNFDSNFSLDPTNGTLSVRSPLVYETIHFQPGETGKMTLTVEARDKGTPVRSSTTSVVIMLQDVNSKYPYCTNLQSKTSVLENATKSFPFFQINATDEDVTEPNNVVMFSIDQESAGKFVIDSNTGWLSVRDKLDREDTDSYNITVTVTDFGIPAKSGKCQVSVTISDVNDSPPFYLQKPKSILKDENQNFSADCSASDNDLSSELVYHIDWNASSALDKQGGNVNSDIKNWISIDSKTGIVTSRKPLDREQVTEFGLVIVVEDINAEENKPQTSTAMLTIKVNDLNDVLPIFVNGRLYNASIRENMPDGSDVKFETPNTLEVFDADDKGENSNFNVRILTHNTTFGINPSWGTFRQTFVISVLNSSALDYEVTTSYTLEVIVEDPNNSSMNNLATIVVNIINENDNIPEFIGGPFHANVSEDGKSNDLVFLVQATDKDLGVYGELTYSMIDNSKRFDIRDTTGEIFLLSGGLDRENVSEYTVTLIATDKGNFRTTTQLIITVTDVNDNSPQFLKGFLSFTINEGDTIIPPEFHLQATDTDEPGTVNSQIKYSLLNANQEPQSHFSIDPTTGQLKLISPLDSESLNPALNSTFMLNILASDQGIPQHSANVSVVVTVKDVNDNAPIFDNSTYIAYVSEAASQGDFVLTVRAIDIDVTYENSEVFYMLDILSAKTFNINSNGRITISGKLDKEQTSQYPVIVTARDNGQPIKTTTCLVNIDVLDVNDEPPKFSWDSLSVTVKENTKTLIAQNTAQDLDDNPDLHYSILWSDSTGMDGNGLFIPGDALKGLVTVNTSGAVFPFNELDREKVQRFQLTLVVEDRNNIAGTERNDTAMLVVVVDDENDTPPLFNGVSLTAEIRENMPTGSEIKVLNASALTVTDSDGANNNAYHITLEDSSVFSISPSQGSGSTSCVIKVHDPSVLDYEQTQTVILKAFAVDSNNPNMNSSVTITVNIINENDNIPEFSGGPYHASVSENSISHTSVFSAHATDKDLGDFGVVSYSLEDTSKM